jgi:hypothetical protein
MITVGRYRAMALAMDGAIERAHMGHPDFRVNGRIFCTIQTDERGGLMLTPDQQRIFVRDRPSAFVLESGAWGLQGATRVIFAEVDEETLGEALTLAWQNRAFAAPKKGAAKKATPTKATPKTTSAKNAGAKRAAAKKTAAKKTATPARKRAKKPVPPTRRRRA